MKYIAYFLTLFHLSIIALSLYSIGNVEYTLTLFLLVGTGYFLIKSKKISAIRISVAYIFAVLIWFTGSFYVDIHHISFIVKLKEYFDVGPETDRGFVFSCILHFIVAIPTLVLINYKFWESF
jgi:hypothetical protein